MKRKKKHFKAIKESQWHQCLKSVIELLYLQSEHEYVYVEVCFSANIDQDSPVIRGGRWWGPSTTMYSVWLLTQA